MAARLPDADLARRSSKRRTRRCLIGRPAAIGLFSIAMQRAIVPVADAQSIQTYFPTGNTGYDQELGVTVLSRLRPLFEPQGVRVGSFVVSPSLDQSLAYNSNVTGLSNSGGFGSLTSANVSAASDWVRDSLDATAGVTQSVYAIDPGLSYTDWNVGLGGGYTIDRSQLTLAYSHQSYNELGTTIGTVTSTTPILDQTDSLNSAYTFDLGTLSITPDVSASAYRFGNATVDGQTIDQSLLNRNVIAGGLTARYAMEEAGSLLLVTRGVGTSYTNQVPIQPDQSSDSVLVLGGIDYQAKDVFRYQLLAGVEHRSFTATQYKTRIAPVLQGNVIWSPTGLTTVTGTVSREIDDPESAGSNGFVLTELDLVLDHELQPNVFVEGRGGFQIADYLQGGSQTAFTLGASANWLLNRRVRLSLDFAYHQQTGLFEPSGNAGLNSVVTNAFRQDVATLTVHFGL